MLGSHFDLAQEIKVIAAKRGGVVDAPTKSAKSDPLAEDFDRRLAAFLDSVSPILVDSGSRQDFGSPRRYDRD